MGHLFIMKKNVAMLNRTVSKWSVVVTVIFTLCAMSLFSAPSAAATTVKFEATKPFKGSQVTLRAKLFKPEGNGPFPAVILMHGCGGWLSSVTYALQTHAKYLNKQGFAVLSIDSFGPRKMGGGKVCKSYKRLGDARKYRSFDAFDGLRYLQAQKFIQADNIFLMGQSNGGSVAINVAKANAAKKYNNSKSAFRGVVAYYPWCGAFGGNAKLGSPLMIFGGQKDDWVPPTACTKVKAQGASLQVKVYPNAVHSFDLEMMVQRYNGKLVGGDKAATIDSRKRMLAFFKKNIKRTSLAMK